MLIFATISNIAPASFKRHSRSFLDAFSSAIGFWGDAGILSLAEIGGSGMETTLQIKIERQSIGLVKKIAKTVDTDSCKEDIVRVLNENPFSTLRLKASSIDFLKPIQSHERKGLPLLHVDSDLKSADSKEAPVKVNDASETEGDEKSGKPHLIIVAGGILLAVVVWVYYERKDRVYPGYAGVSTSDRGFDRRQGGRRETADRLEGGSSRNEASIRRRSSGGGTGN